MPWDTSLPSYNLTTPNNLQLVNTEVKLPSNGRCATTGRPPRTTSRQRTPLRLRGRGWCTSRAVTGATTRRRASGGMRRRRSTAILLHPILRLVRISIVMKRGGQQNDSLGLSFCCTPLSLSYAFQ